jgi:putative aldouronate transport system substrate-binding protein
MVLAAPGGFEAVWNEYLAEYNKLDVKGYEEFMTNKVKARVEGKW